MNSSAVCVEIPPRTDVEFSVCARLLRAMSHMIRGDLSVVTNDLAYLSTIVPPEELERPRGRCSSAAATLAKVNIITSGVMLGGISLPALTRELGGSSDERAIVVCGDASKLAWVGQTLRTLFGETSIRGVTCLPHEDVVIECAATRPSFVGNCARSCERMLCDSVSDYVARGLGEREIVEAALLDLVFQAFNWRMCLEIHPNHVLIRLRVPRAEKERSGR